MSFRSISFVLLVLIWGQFSVGLSLSQTEYSPGTGLDWNADNTKIALISPDGSLDVIDVTTSQVIDTMQVVQSSEGTRDMAWSPTNPDRLAVATEIGGYGGATVRIYDLVSSSLQEIASIAVGESVLKIEWDGSGARIATLVEYFDELQSKYFWDVRIWDVNTGDMVQELLVLPSQDIDWPQNTNQIMVLTFEDGIEMWDLSSGTGTTVYPRGDDELERDIASSKDGSVIALGYDNSFGGGYLKLIETASGNVIELPALSPASYVDWSSQDQLAAYIPFEGEGFVNIYSRDGILLDQIETAWGTGFSWSNDGTRLAFIRNGSLEIANAPLVSQQSIAALTLVNATTDQDIRTLTNNDTIDIATTPNINIRANTDPATVGSVGFELTGAETHSETEAGKPYALFSDSGGDYNSWTPTPGTYTLTVTPYTEVARGGTAGTPLTITFDVIDSSQGSGASIASRYLFHEVVSKSLTHT